MIIDTSALIAVILGEPDAERYLRAMETASELCLSAATLVEALIVVHAKQGPEAAVDLQSLIAELDATVVPFDEGQANLAAAAWDRFGKGRHSASLNLGDLFSYALAQRTGEPLLYKGDDFTQTDVQRA